MRTVTLLEEIGNDRGLKYSIKENKRWAHISPIFDL